MKLILLFGILFCRCGSVCAAEKWKTIDLGFRISVPSEWQEEKLQGVDSHVGRINGVGAYLEFDENFGMFQRFEERRKELVQERISEMKRQAWYPSFLMKGKEIWHVDGRIARFTFSTVDPKKFGTRPYRNVATISVPYDDPPRYGGLQVLVFYENEDFLPTIRQILRSLKWPKREPHETPATNTRP